MKRLALILAALLATSPALAFDDATRSAIDARATAFETHFLAGNYQAAFRMLPPPVLTMLSEKTGVSEDGLIDAMAEQLVATTNATEITITGFDLDTTAMFGGETSSGRGYAFIPTDMAMSVGDKTGAASAPTLAVEDGGEWYFVRIENQEHYDMVRLVYPSFDGVSLP